MSCFNMGSSCFGDITVVVLTLNSWEVSCLSFYYYVVDNVVLLFMFCVTTRYWVLLVVVCLPYVFEGRLFMIVVFVLFCCSQYERMNVTFVKIKKSDWRLRSVHLRWGLFN
jgi:hypothetical protein